MEEAGFVQRQKRRPPLGKGEKIVFKRPVWGIRGPNTNLRLKMKRKAGFIEEGSTAAEDKIYSPKLYWDLV